MHAAQRGRLDIVKALIEARADVNAANDLNAAKEGAKAEVRPRWSHALFL
jgi:ankyrin repeat protein